MWPNAAQHRVNDAARWSRFLFSEREKRESQHKNATAPKIGKSYCFEKNRFRNFCHAWVSEPRLSCSSSSSNDARFEMLCEAKRLKARRWLNESDAKRCNSFVHTSLLRSLPERLSSSLKIPAIRKRARKICDRTKATPDEAGKKSLTNNAKT